MYSLEGNEPQLLHILNYENCSELRLYEDTERGEYFLFRDFGYEMDNGVYRYFAEKAFINGENTAIVSIAEETCITAGPDRIFLSDSSFNGKPVSSGSL